MRGVRSSGCDPHTAEAKRKDESGMKTKASSVGNSKVGQLSGGVAPESVGGATLDANHKTSRGQTPQKGRKPMSKKVKKVTVGTVHPVSHEIWKKGAKKIPVSITFQPVNGCGEEGMWIALAVWCEKDADEVVWKTESAIAQDYAQDIACNAYDDLADKLCRFHDFDGVQEG